MNRSSLRSFVSIAALVGCSALVTFCSYYPSETSNGTGGTTTTSTATGGSAGYAQGGNAQGGGGASQGGGGSAQGGNGTGGSTSSGGSGGSPPTPFLTCADVAAGHGVMKVEVVGDFPPGLERIAADGSDNKTANVTWMPKYIGASGDKQAVMSFGTVAPNVFLANFNWGLAPNDTTVVVGGSTPVVAGGTYLCYYADCMHPLQALDATVIWCHGPTELCRTDNTKVSGFTGAACSFVGNYQANVEVTVP